MHHTLAGLNKLLVWFTDLTFMDGQVASETVKIGPFETFSLYHNDIVKYRFKHLQLTATRSTHYQPLECQESSSFYSPRVVTPISQLRLISADQLAYREIDTVGIVVSTISDHVTSHDPERSERLVDSVFVADAEGCLMVVRIWEGVKVSIGTRRCTMSYDYVHVMRHAYINTCTSEFD